jgi:hypothetical protein
MFSIRLDIGFLRCFLGRGIGFTRIAEAHIATAR